MKKIDQSLAKGYKHSGTPMQILVYTVFHGTQFVETDTLYSWTDHFSNSGNLYKYALVNQGSHIDVAIQKPVYGSLASDLSTLHLLPLGYADSFILKISFTYGKEPKTEEEALMYMQAYFEMTDIYIKTGKSFQEQMS